MDMIDMVIESQLITNHIQVAAVNMSEAECFESDERQAF